MAKQVIEYSVDGPQGPWKRMAPSGHPGLVHIPLPEDALRMHLDFLFRISEEPDVKKGDKWIGVGGNWEYEVVSERLTSQRRDASVYHERTVKVSRIGTNECFHRTQSEQRIDVLLTQYRKSN